MQSEGLNKITKLTIKCLKHCHIGVVAVVNILASIVAVGEINLFSNETIGEFKGCKNHSELFKALQVYYSPLAFNFLCYLMKQCFTEIVHHKHFKRILKKDKKLKVGHSQSCVLTLYGKMSCHKDSVKEFRLQTTIRDSVCLNRNCNPPRDFQKMVVSFGWHAGTKLEHVYEFEKLYAQKHRIKKYAFILSQIEVHTHECIITWFVASNVVKVLTEECNLGFIRQFTVKKIDIDRKRIYPIVKKVRSSLFLQEEVERYVYMYNVLYIIL